ncbi:MAG: 4-hydroxy-tetrahydrodipicolinate reductase [Endomicrobium sp.]|jgi:4-hydroxy-tetrahydrodipicolinate reductase|nr:4-hydroxy-tetrahydrodipicolinate reductase [Endomicrobium sp.]
MKIVICGSSGRMGKAIIKLAKLDKKIRIIEAFESDSNEAIGTGDPIIRPAKDLEKFLLKTDSLIDFTSPNSTLKNLEIIKNFKIPMVIGTTGFDKDQKNKIINASKNIPIVFSPNMSIGVNILFKLVEIIAKKISDYDIEIVELHHNKKKDSPSGTAMKLAEIAAKSSLCKNIDDNNIFVYDRHLKNTIRNKGEIGLSSVRAGDIIGDHTVYFAGPGERIELIHRAHSRDTFASGAIIAAKWIVNKNPGLYDMSDVLNIKNI